MQAGGSARGPAAGEVGFLPQWYKRYFEYGAGKVCRRAVQMRERSDLMKHFMYETGKRREL
ncbi:MAG: hypothetical protein DRG82_14405 [Deltaproteobacteria bacterium]|nr:MAG: hypothetical protein DRG82_14405 [Deltaproteobacteria bacterium]